MDDKSELHSMFADLYKGVTIGTLLYWNIALVWVEGIIFGRMIRRQFYAAVLQGHQRLRHNIPVPVLVCIDD